MVQLLFVLNIIHRITLVILLTIFAIAPLLSEMSIFSSYIVLPSVFIFISMTTIYIENSLNKYRKALTVTQKVKKHKKCLIRYGICCLHH
jgi:succinate dehydrogenase/fumarate reductase cytochrome b subunit